jgi:D-cysteine desulfhydrase
VLRAHTALGTRLVPYGGDYPTRIATLRRNLWGHDALVVAPGGSSWLGTFGFVQAGRELAAQVAGGLMPAPDRLYVATGTMGSAAGLALGLALAGLATEVQAVRVSHSWLCNEDSLYRTMTKVTAMLRRIAPAIPADLPQRAKIRLRHGFFAGGYAHTDERTEAAIAFAASELDLALESTYTGKAMAALLHDLPGCDACCLFWNTYNSARLPQPATRPQADAEPPSAFSRYFS